MTDQAGRVAIVTGGGLGPGRAIAHGLAGRGATVAVVARSQDRSGVAFPADVADAAAVSRLAGEVDEHLGTPTILVKAAGVFGPIALIKDADPDAWRQTVIIDAGWGRIVNVTSAASLHPPGPMNSAYGVSKVALNQLTRHLAAEVAGSGVTANVIHPGDVKTDMWADIRNRSDGMGADASNYTERAA